MNQVVEFGGAPTLVDLSKFLETGGEHGRRAPGDDADYDDDDEGDDSSEEVVHVCSSAGLS